DIQATPAGVCDKLAHHGESRGRKLAVEQTVHERELARSADQFAAEAELKVVVAIYEIGDCQQLVGQGRLALCRGTNAELFDALDKLGRVRPAGSSCSGQ